MNWPKVLAWIAKNVLLVGVGAAVALYWGGACQRRFSPVITGQSVRLEDTREAAKMEVAPSQTCPDLPTLQPSKKQRDRLAERFNRPDLVPPETVTGPTWRVVEPGDTEDSPGPVVAPAPAREVLALKELPPAEFGGDLLVSRVSGSPVDVDFKANRAPLIAFPARIYAEGLYGQTGGEDPAMWVAKVRGDLLRVKGVVTLGAEAGRLHAFGQEQWYAAGSVSWRLR